MAISQNIMAGVLETIEIVNQGAGSSGEQVHHGIPDKVIAESGLHGCTNIYAPKAMTQ